MFDSGGGHFGLFCFALLTEVTARKHTNRATEPCWTASSAIILYP